MERMETSDAAAVARVLAGDRDAFRELVDRHSRSIFRLGFRMTGNEHDAEEVVQETFLRAYRRLKGFESRANFGTWLYRIGVSCSLDLMRSRQRRDAAGQASRPVPPLTDDSPDPIAMIPSEAPGPDRLLLSTEVGARVEQALAQLSPNERAAFVMRHYEGRPVEEIGRALGLRANATKNTVFRAVQKLRRALEPVAGPRIARRMETAG